MPAKERGLYSPEFFTDQLGPTASKVAEAVVPEVASTIVSPDEPSITILRETTKEALANQGLLDCKAVDVSRIALAARLHWLERN